MKKGSKDPSVPLDPLALCTALSQIERETGLTFSENRWPVVAGALRAAAVEAGLKGHAAGIADLLTRIPRHRRIELLAPRLTVGETYFFRDEAQFSLLADWVIPTLRGQPGRSGRPLAFWSAACATGEEPYSLALTLDRLSTVPGLEQARILATDINQEALQKARKGRYSHWSFRHTPPWVLQSGFKTLPGGRREVREDLRKRITFRSLNLALDGWPSPRTGTTNLDVIFCRNVLLYFSAEQAARVISRLYHALAPGGFLFVSPTESLLLRQGSFRCIQKGNVFLFQRPEAAPVGRGRGPGGEVWRKATLPMPHQALAEAPGQWLPTPRVAEHPAGALPRAAPVETMPSPLPMPPPPLPMPEQTLREARALADRGDWKAATACLGTGAGTLLMSPEAHLLRAEIAREQGQYREAEGALRRALYLSPNHPRAWFLRACLALSEGRPAVARRYFERVRHLLGGLPADASLPAFDGLTPGRVLSWVETLTSTPGAAPGKR